MRAGCIKDRDCQDAGVAGVNVIIEHIIVTVVFAAVLAKSW